MENVELYFHNALKFVDDVKDVKILYSDKDKIIGEMKYLNIKVNFMEVSEKDRNIYLNMINQINEIPDGKSKEFKRKLNELSKEINKITGVYLEYTVNNKEGVVEFDYMTSVPYTGNNINNIQHLIQPLLNIMYHVHIRILLFFLENKSE